MPTYCRDCDHVHPDTRGGDPWKWRCMKVPVAAGYRFVDPTFAPNPPFAKCDQVNTDGECGMFKPVPNPNESETPKTKQFNQHKRQLETTKR